MYRVQPSSDVYIKFIRQGQYIHVPCDSIEDAASEALKFIMASDSIRCLDSIVAGSDVVWKNDSLASPFTLMGLIYGKNWKSRNSSIYEN